MEQRSRDLRDWLKTNPSERPKENHLLRSTLRTFEAIFGKTWAGEANGPENDDAAETVQGQIGWSSHDPREPSPMLMLMDPI